ncbi:acyltransferase family protein [Epilithonimonas hispanica]|uniref:Acyltransferase 3 domain-containing protein n=1 Tax=Epilithonimonas hispanica TaxID=358687 RepID=A0A3D9CQR5_9FLAO|nr:acyltransferase [Epilithonimonas hispanica]REC68102.1 hypothetical protein DRF58_14480 [Epilithonimonas hispanica]
MRNSQIVNLRVFAIFFVVIGHCVIIFDPRWDIYHPTYPSKSLYYFKEFINSFQMQLFFSISGFLYYYSKNKKNNIEFIIDKGKRLLIPFLFVGLVYLIPIRFLAHYPNYSNGYFSALGDFFIKNDCGHLWFLPTLFGIFIISKYLISFVENSIVLKLALFVIAILTSVFNGHFPSFLYINLILKWEVFFLLGYYVHAYKDVLFDKRYKNLWYLGVIVLPPLLYIRFLTLQTSIGAPIRFVFSILMVLIMYRFMPSKTSELISFFDKNSFGIYLFHAPVIYVVFDNFYYMYPWQLVGIAFFSSCSIALLITYSLRLLKLEIMIGEK